MLIQRQQQSDRDAYSIHTMFTHFTEVSPLQNSWSGYFCCCEWCSIVSVRRHSQHDDMGSFSGERIGDRCGVVFASRPACCTSQMVWNGCIQLANANNTGFHSRGRNSFASSSSPFLFFFHYSCFILSLCHAGTSKNKHNKDATVKTVGNEFSVVALWFHPFFLLLCHSVSFVLLFFFFFFAIAICVLFGVKMPAVELCLIEKS